MSPELIFVTLAAIGSALGVASLLALRSTGASPSRARRLAGPPERRVGDLLDDAEPAERPVRVLGRIRCRDPLEAGDGERLVAFHRDVEVRIGRSWRTVERIRETRSFDLWDHDGSVPFDPALAAEPLITIPQVWRGDPSQLEEPHASTVRALVERHGPATDARAITRTLNVTDRLLVLARPVRSAGEGTRLEPPPGGGYLITNLGLADAMRLLGGSNRRITALAVVGLGAGVAFIAIGLVGAGLSVLIG